MRERMTDKEREQLKALQAKEKRVQRAEADFLQEADERKEELLKRWGIVLQQKPTKPRTVTQPAPVEAIPTTAPAPVQPDLGPLEFDPL